MLNLRFGLVVVVAVMAGCVSHHTSSPAASSESSPGEFVPLFNGHDLADWVYGSKAGQGYKVRSDDGTPVIYCTVADGGNLYTEKEYANFHLRFEFKLTPGANNGIG